MTRDEIIDVMLGKEPHSLFYTMELGGNMRQLSKMEAEGLIRSQSRHGHGRQRDWYLSDVQWTRHHDDIHGRDTVAAPSNS
jgi:hypothetical protein